MALKSAQLCDIDPRIDDAGVKLFHVTVWSDELTKFATFTCATESAALALCAAIREHADRLYRAADYRGAAPEKPSLR
jgi:hypothetical protein